MLATRKSRPDLRLVHPTESATPSPAPVDEAELIDDLCSASPRRTRELYRYLEPVVHAAIVRVIGRGDGDHEDLIQSAFEAIATSILEGRFARSCKLTTWASVIAARTGLMAIRSRRRARRWLDPASVDLAPEPVEPSGDAERIATTREDLLLVRQVLADMKPAFAEVVVLHDALGHDLREIASLLDVTVAAAQSRLVRGRADFVTRYKKREARR